MLYICVPRISHSRSRNPRRETETQTRPANRTFSAWLKPISRFPLDQAFTKLSDRSFETLNRPYPRLQLARRANCCAPCVSPRLGCTKAARARHPSRPYRDGRVRLETTSTRRLTPYEERRIRSLNGARSAVQTLSCAGDLLLIFPGPTEPPTRTEPHADHRGGRPTEPRRRPMRVMQLPASPPPGTERTPGCTNCVAKRRASPSPSRCESRSGPSMRARGSRKAPTSTLEGAHAQHPSDPALFPIQ